MTNVDPQGSTYDLANRPAVEIGSIGSSNTQRVYGRQISSGNIRGNQNITGVFTVLDVASSNPIVSIDGTTDYMLITDPATKVNQIIIGKLPDNTYGIVVSKTGTDVLTVFS